MKLTDILKSEHVLLPLRAATVKEATEQLADRLVAAGAVAEPQRLLAVIKHAWPEDMVSVGEHAFLPHFRTEAVRGLIAAVGVAEMPTAVTRPRTASVRKWGRNACSPTLTMSSGQVWRITALRR